VLVAARETSDIPDEVKVFGENICWRILSVLVVVSILSNTSIINPNAIASTLKISIQKN
jgi:hypothetical protein